MVFELIKSIIMMIVVIMFILFLSIASLFLFTFTSRKKALQQLIQIFIDFMILIGYNKCDLIVDVENSADSFN